MPPTATLPEHQLYTTLEVARMMNISRSAVYEKANRPPGRDGRIPGLLRIGGTVRIDRETFDRWFAELRGEAR